MTFAGKNISKKIQLAASFFSALLLMSCGSYYSTGSDGIYGSRDGTKAPQERTETPRAQVEGEGQESTNEYGRYFATQSSQIEEAQRYVGNQNREQEEVFTDPDEYYSDEDYENEEFAPSYTNNSQVEYANTNTEYVESNPGWGVNPTTVNVNYYGGYYTNPYLYSPYYSSFYPFYSSYYPFYPYHGYYRPYLSMGFGFGYAGFYGGYYGGYYSPFYRPYYYGYGSRGYYGNPYYAYSLPSRYPASRNYRSSSTARSNIRSAAVPRRSATTTAQRSATGRTTRSTATQARRSASTVRTTSATARNAATRSASSRRITNPKGINAGRQRASAMNSSRSSSFPSARTRTTTSQRAPVMQRSTPRRSNAPARATQSNTPARSSAPAVRSTTRSSSFGGAVRSSGSRSSGSRRR